MTPKFIVPFILICTAPILSCDKDENDPAKPTPSITNFSPASGIVGDEVTITGADFGESGNTVTFNGSPAEITTQSKTSIIVSVPEAATTGKIGVTSHEKETLSSNNFTILIPTITAVSGNIGSPGLTIKIDGTNFSPTPTFNKVKFNGEAATVQNASSTQLEVIVPESATTGTIEVKVGSQSATTLTAFEICTNKPELVISNVVFTNIGGSSFNFTFDLTNNGGNDLDLSQMTLQNYVSADAVYGGGDQPAGGLTLSGGGILEQGETYTGSWTSNQSAATYPYLIMQVYNSGTTITECNTTNNQHIIKIE